MTAALRLLLQRNVPAACAAYVLDDLFAGLKLAVGWTTATGGSHAADAAERAGDTVRIFKSYCQLAGRSAFPGDAIELGPGDNLGIQIMLRAHGAATAGAIDRFYSRRDSDTERNIHARIAGQFDLGAVSGDPARPIDGVYCHYGEAAETYFADKPERFDTILSAAVMEHTYAPMAALDAMMRALRPGGVMVHCIDIHDHGMFVSDNPLTYLTVPEIIYRRMVRYSGRPNRCLKPQFDAWARRQPAGTARVVITQLIGEARGLDEPVEQLPASLMANALRHVRAIRPRLRQPFSGYGDADLCVRGCALVVHKPPG